MSLNLGCTLSDSKPLMPVFIPQRFWFHWSRECPELPRRSCYPGLTVILRPNMRPTFPFWFYLSLHFLVHTFPDALASSLIPEDTRQAFTSGHYTRSAIFSDLPRYPAPSLALSLYIRVFSVTHSLATPDILYLLSMIYILSSDHCPTHSIHSFFLSLCQNRAFCLLLQCNVPTHRTVIT